MRSPSGLPSLMKARSGARLLAVFALTVLAPGALLVLLAARALTQETQRADQEVANRLTRTAERAAQVLAETLDEWKAAADATIDEQGDIRTLPPAAAEAPEGLATVATDAGGLRVSPANALAYVVDGQPPPPEAALPVSLEFGQAERLERQGRTTEAAQTYGRLRIESHLPELGAGR